MTKHAVDLAAVRSDVVDLVDLATRSGEEVVFTRGGEAVAKIVPMSDNDDGWTKLAEESFAFWDNEEDAIYDAL